MKSIAPFSAPGRFWRGNLHTHSDLSDGALPLDEVVNRYKAVGYDFVLISEHFCDHFNWPIADTRHLRGNTFTTILGAELHAPVTSAGELWHIVAAGLPLDFPAAKKGETGPEIAKRAIDAGAFLAIAHPSWSRYTIEDGRALSFAHAVEIYNHGCAIENDLGEGFYLLDQMLNEGRPFRRLGACEGGKPRPRCAAGGAEGGPPLFLTRPPDQRHPHERQVDRDRHVARR